MTFQGIHAALVTPFTASGEVDTASLERLARHCLENGADGLVALGTTGETATLTPDERRTVLETCRAVSDEHGARLIAGAGTMGTGKAVLCGDDACIYRCSSSARRAASPRAPASHRAPTRRIRGARAAAGAAPRIGRRGPGLLPRPARALEGVQTPVERF